MTQDYAIWKPEHDGHAPPNWREGMKVAADGLSWTAAGRDWGPNWWEGQEYKVPAEALNSPNDDVSGDIPAFPTHGQAEGDDPRNQILTGGMTLRDYFAAAALQGICASQFIADHAPKGEPEAIAKRAGEIADAMIAERSKRDA